MAKISAFAQGIKTLTGTTYRQIAGLTTTGIAAFAGGTKLCFLNATHPHWVVVGATADVSEVYVDGFYKGQASLSPHYKSIGDSILGRTPVAADYGTIVTAPEGFAINIDTDVNVDGEQLIWMAIG